MAHQCKIFFMLTFFISLPASDTSSCTHLKKRTFKEQIDLYCHEEIDSETEENNNNNLYDRIKSRQVDSTFITQFISAKSEFGLEKPKKISQLKKTRERIKKFKEMQKQPIRINLEAIQEYFRQNPISELMRKLEGEETI